MAVCVLKKKWSDILVSGVVLLSERHNGYWITVKSKSMDLVSENFQVYRSFFNKEEIVGFLFSCA